MPSSASSLLLLLLSLAAPPAEVEGLTDRAFQQAAALAAPAVVRIDTVGGREQLEPGMVSSGATTGLLVSPDGYLVSSAFHFVSQPSSILVTLFDGRRLAARQIATDRQRMITLLKVEAERLPTPIAAPKESFRVGQWAIALGRTFEAESPSVSVGIVSALNRVWGKAIQTDAKVSPVNYGGPLIDIEGRVLGVLAPLSPHESGDTAGVEWYDSGIGFAVPLVDILSVVDRLKTGDDLLPGLLGVTFKGKDLIQGEPLIDRVRFGSPAEQAGLKPGDRLTALDGSPITRMAQLRHILGAKYAGESLRCEVLRDKQTLEVDLILAGELPPFTPAFLGILPSRNPGDSGAAVRFVWPDSPAAIAGLKSKDVIEQVQGIDVATPAELADQLGRLRVDAVVKLRVRRGDKSAELTASLVLPPTALPTDIPAPAPFGVQDRPEGTKTGRLMETLAGHDREYWLYIPENYRPDQPHALVVFLHPSGNPSEQGALAAWRAECERRSIILLAPRVEGRGGWSPNDQEFINDAIKHVREKYMVAGDRIAVLGMGNAAPVAAVLAFRQPDLIRGLALIDSPPLGRVPENSPERRLQIYSLARGASIEAAKWTQAVSELRKAGYPAVLSRSDEEAGAYPTPESNAELVRWVDSLDRL